MLFKIFYWVLEGLEEFFFFIILKCLFYKLILVYVFVYNLIKVLVGFFLFLDWFRMEYFGLS